MRMIRQLQVNMICEATGDSEIAQQHQRQYCGDALTFADRFKI